MKYQFTPEELDILDRSIERLKLAAGVSKNAEISRVASKLRYKFTPNVTQVNLTGKDRRTIKDLFSFILSNISDMENLSVEAATMESILERL